MNGSKTYIEIARGELRTADALLGAGEWNAASRYCEQYIEKLFKEYIVNNGLTENEMKLLTSHNLIRLSERVSELSGLCFDRSGKRMFRLLQNYWFDTSYLGDRYTDLTEEDAKETLEWTLDFQSRYEETIAGLGPERSVDNRLSP